MLFSREGEKISLYLTKKTLFSFSRGGKVQDVAALKKSNCVFLVSGLPRVHLGSFSGMGKKGIAGEAMCCCLYLRSSEFNYCFVHVLL